MESFNKHPRKNTEEKEEQADWNNVTTNLKKKKDSNNDNDDDNSNNNDDDDDDDDNNNNNNWIDLKELGSVIMLDYGITLKKMQCSKKIWYSQRRLNNKSCNLHNLRK